MRGRALIVDDDAAMCELLAAGLLRSDFQIATTTTADAALTALGQEEFDVVVTDLSMRGMNGLELCARLAESHPGVPVIVITAFGSLDTAVAAIRAGAYDFLTKPLEIEALVLALDRAIQYRGLREEVKRLRSTLAQATSFQDVLGESPVMKKLYDLLARVAEADASVLITGETGTGKELVARALHRGSRRGPGPFVAVSCAAVPEPLLESELFGHAKGAFTDAKTARKGLFLEAAGGTLFLDEIGAMPLGLQPKLLRVLQERRVRPVGADREQPVDVRLIAATNCDLETAVEEGQFREDLFFRINVIHVPLPPLRARGNDVLLLAQHFIQQYAARAGKRVMGLSSAAAQKLLAYTWPGNVRELQNCVERALALTNFDQLTVDDLPDRIRDYTPTRSLLVSDDPAELLTLEEVERRYILRVLETVGGNKTLAANTLGLDRKTLYRKLERYLPRSESNAGSRAR
jgi:two-component system response regulator HydG